MFQSPPRISSSVVHPLRFHHMKANMAMKKPTPFSRNTLIAEEKEKMPIERQQDTPQSKSFTSVTVAFVENNMPKCPLT